MRKFVTVQLRLEVPPKGMTLPQVLDFIRTAIRSEQINLPAGSIMKTANFDDLTASVLRVETDYRA